MRSGLIALAVFALGAFQGDGPQRGKIKTIDAEKGVVVLSSGNKEIEATADEKTRFMGADGKPLKDRLASKALVTGAEVMFKVDDKNVLIGLKVGGPGKQPALKLVKVDTTRLRPLTDLGTEKYKDYPGGLYPGGKNVRPDAHEKAGLALAKKVQPLDGDGEPSADGKIVLLSVGMSNTTQEFSAFKRLADADRAKNPHLLLVDGAQGGMTAAAIRDADAGRGKQYWTTIDARLKAAGATRQQVQVAWIKEADAGPTQGFPRYARTLQAELGDIVRLMKARFPNLRIAYLSSRICAAFARTGLNPEPYAYESGFSVKWLIERQIEGDETLNHTSGKAPWLSWGPYLWANGITKRGDGLTYVPSDFAPDGTHPSRSGQQKVAGLLLEFFKTDTTAKPWFIRR